MTLTSPNAAFIAANQVWAYQSLRALQAARAGDEAALESHLVERDRADEAVEAMAGDDIPFVVRARAMELSALEQRLVRLALAVAVDAKLGRVLADLHGHLAEHTLHLGDLAALLTGDDGPSARVRMLDFLEPSWRLRADRVLRVVRDDDALTRSRVEITRAALDLFTGTRPDLEGVHYWPNRASLRRRVPSRAVLNAAQRAAIDATLMQLRESFVQRVDAVTRGNDAMLVLLWGPPGVGKGTVAFELAAAHSAARVVEVDGAALALTPDVGERLEQAIDLAVLRQATLLVRDGHELFSAGARARRFVELLRHAPVLALVTSNERTPSPLLEREWHAVFGLARRDDEAGDLWEAHLPPEVALDNDIDLASLKARFRLDGPAVARAIGGAVARAMSRPHRAIGMHDLEVAAMQQLDSDLGSLVRTIHPHHALDALVLPERHIAEIRQIIDACRSWPYLLGQWGLAKTVSTGRSISCLFAGEPGTGKTFAAEVIASAIDQPLHIVSLPSIVSKWMGETERNISTLFAKAQLAGAALLFDEADTLFASRVEASTSNDHSRNMITGALLQELDRHSGLVIMTTNFTKNIDKAFHRRIMFHLEFPQPDEAARLSLWQGMLPRELPRGDDLDLHDLSQRFELSGGEIKNVVLRAAITAWADGGVLMHRHLVRASEQEYRRVGRLVRHGG